MDGRPSRLSHMRPVERSSNRSIHLSGSNIGDLICKLPRSIGSRGPLRNLYNSSARKAICYQSEQIKLQFSACNRRRCSLISLNTFICAPMICKSIWMFAVTASGTGERPTAPRRALHKCTMQTAPNIKTMRWSSSQSDSIYFPI